MAGKLADSDMDQLESWIGTGPKMFTLLYDIVRDGCDPTIFHQKCNNQGPTVTVLYNQHGSVYGGYTSVSWIKSGGQYITDDKAFLYQLRLSSSLKPTKFPVTTPDRAILSNNEYGPLFGNGHDLITFNGIIKNSGGHFKLNGKLNIGTAYSAQGVTAADINNGTMDVTDLEVYKVTDGQRQKQLQKQKPWRQTPDLNKKFLSSLLEEVQTFQPVSDVGISEFRILMLGPVGSGKSSFYNTINSVFRGRISQRAITGNSVHSTTTAYTPYTFRTKSGSSLKFRLCDTRGLEETLGLDTMECSFLLGGHIPDFYKFNPSVQLSVESPEFVLKPKPSDKVHCVLFVIDASTVDSIPSKTMDKMASFRNIMNQKEVPQAVVLTKIDEVSENVQKHLANVFKDEKIQRKVNEIAKLFGFPPNAILPVKNYVHEMELDDTTSALALLALRQVLYYAEDYMENVLMKMDKDMSVSRESGEHDVQGSDTA